MSDFKKILSCPFCGGMPHIIFNVKLKNAYGQEVEGTAIGCENCDATIFNKSGRLAIEAWNHRVPEVDEYEVRCTDDR